MDMALPHVQHVHVVVDRFPTFDFYHHLFIGISEVWNEASKSNSIAPFLVESETNNRSFDMRLNY